MQAEVPYKQKSHVSRSSTEAKVPRVQRSQLSPNYDAATRVGLKPGVAKANPPESVLYPPKFSAYEQIKRTNKITHQHTQKYLQEQG